MNTDKIKRLILEATEDSNLRDKLRRDSRDVALLQAREYGANVPITEKMLKYATRVGDTDKISQASDAYRATRLAKALGDDDLNYIIDHAQELNRQGKEALIELLMNRGETGKLYSLNDVLGGEFINKDLKQKVSRDQARLLDEAVANEDLEKKFYSKINDEQAAELSGMGVDPKTDPVRSRLIADRMKKGQPVDTTVDEMFNADISNQDLAKNPRYKQWISQEQRRLTQEAADRGSPTRRELARDYPTGDSRVDAITEASKRDQANIDRLMKRGDPRDYYEIEDLKRQIRHRRKAESNLEPIELGDDLGDIDAENVMNQFLDPKEQEWIKPTPRSRDYGEETLMLRDRKRGIAPKQSIDDRRKELIELASNVKGEGRDIPVYRGRREPDTFLKEKEVLRQMYPRLRHLSDEEILKIIGK